MITLFTRFGDYLYPHAIRDLRRAVKRQAQQKRAASGHGSSISSREFEHRKRNRKIADAARRRNRRMH